MNRIKVFLILIIFGISIIHSKELTFASIFTENVVLQRESKILIWGESNINTQITLRVSWNNKSYKTYSNNKGEWKINIETTKAGGPYYMMLEDIEHKKKTIINNVFLGDVWLASGQSNMSMPLKGYYGQPVEESTRTIMNASKKNINFINIPNLASYSPLKEFSACWKKANMENAGECSAVAYFFAETLFNNIDIPIGIINSSYGGSNIEAWMTPEACKQIPDITIPTLKDSIITNENGIPTTLYNAMLHPIEGFFIKGMIWYQGESNVFNVPRYKKSMVAFVDGIRKAWDIGNFPFYYVQIAPYEYKEWNTFKPKWPEISAYLREAQLMASHEIDNSGMIVLMDAGEKFMIHSRYKKIVGERLAMLALSKTYDFKGYNAISPEFDKMIIEGNKAIISFKNCPLGITSYGKKLTLFEIAGENQVFHQGDAYINENTAQVIVQCKYIDRPVAVRYAFKNFVNGELFSTEGLPISSFRTDNW